MKNLLTVTQAAERLKLSRSRILALARAGRFPGAQLVGSQWVIPEKSVAAFQPQSHGVRLDRKPRKPERARRSIR